VILQQLEPKTTTSNDPMTSTFLSIPFFATGLRGGLGVSKCVQPVAATTKGVGGVQSHPKIGIRVSPFKDALHMIDIYEFWLSEFQYIEFLLFLFN